MSLIASLTFGIPHLRFSLHPTHQPRLLFGPQKQLRRNPRLFENSPESPLRHITGMIGDRRVTAGPWVEPNLMRTRGLAVEHEAKPLQPFHNLPIAKAGELAHLITTDH